MKMKNNKSTCSKCGNELIYFRTNRYLESGEAVMDCRQCGERICSSADWKKKKPTKKSKVLVKSK